MGVWNWLRTLSFFHIFIAGGYYAYQRRPQPLSIYIDSLLIFFPSISWLFWLFPHDLIYYVLYPIYDYTTSITYISVSILIYFGIRYLCIKSLRIRIFVLRKIRIFRMYLVAWLIMICYIKVIEWNMTDNGVCEVPDPVDVIMGRVKDVEEVESGWWQFVFNWIVVTVLGGACGLFGFYFYVPIKLV